MKNVIEFIPAIVAMAAILFVIAFSVWDSGKCDLDENKIES